MVWCVGCRLAANLVRIVIAILRKAGPKMAAWLPPKKRGKSRWNIPGSEISGALSWLSLVKKAGFFVAIFLMADKERGISTFAAPLLLHSPLLLSHKGGGWIERRWIFVPYR